MFLRSDLKIRENVSFKGHGPLSTVKPIYAVYPLNMYFNTKLKINFVFPRYQLL